MVNNSQICTSKKLVVKSPNRSRKSHMFYEQGQVGHQDTLCTLCVYYLMLAANFPEILRLVNCSVRDLRCICFWNSGTQYAWCTDLMISCVRSANTHTHTHTHADRCYLRISAWAALEVRERNDLELKAELLSSWLINDAGKQSLLCWHASNRHTHTHTHTHTTKLTHILCKLVFKHNVHTFMCAVISMQVKYTASLKIMNLSSFGEFCCI